MLPIEGLRSALSAERLNAYALPEDTDEVDRVARYLRDILETIAWINPELAATLEKHSPLPAVLDRGAAGFRAQAEAIVK